MAPCPGGYRGKRVSILGDSISALEGWVPPGWPAYYTAGNSRITGVRGPGDIWWGMVLEVLGATLLVNASWSGSLVTNPRPRSVA